MQVYLLGYKGIGTGASVIKWFGHGSYSHVSLLFIEKVSHYAEEWQSIQGEGVYGRSFEYTRDRYVHDFDIFKPIGTHNVEAILDEAIALDGTKYDWGGIWGFFVRKKRENPNKWFCSEYTAHCFQNGGFEIMRLPHYKQFPIIQCSSLVFNKMTEEEIGEEICFC